jgi:hypothetical protein
MATPVIAALPFTSGAHEHGEPAFTAAFTPGAGVQRQNPTDIPAFGYITAVLMQVVGSGGAGGVAAADAPWNILTDITLQDVNGSVIAGPINGYEAMIANVLGGWSGVRNFPGDSPWFVGSTPNFQFYLRIPVEVSHKDGLGALSNQNSSANYKLTFGVNAAANIWTTAPTTVPLITIKANLEAWTLPAAQDSRGNPQAQVPPLLGTGQYLSVQGPRPTVVNAFTAPFTRLGNYIRFVGIITRDNTGARSDAVAPDPFIFNWDGMQMQNFTQLMMQQRLYERVSGVWKRPAGVWALPFNFGGEYPAMGNESPNLWLPTSQSSRLSIDGSGNSVAGTVTFITCEVAPIEVNQADRYQEHSATGWNPMQGGAVPVAAGSAN